MLLSELDSFQEYMMHKMSSEFSEAEKSILQAAKEFEDDGVPDMDTLGYIWCLHGELCGDLGQFDKLRESFCLALGKSNNSPLVRLDYIRALIYNSIDFEFSFKLADELINEMESVDEISLGEGDLPPNYYLVKVKWYLAYAYCEAADCDNLVQILESLLCISPSNIDSEVDCFFRKFEEKIECLSCSKCVILMLSKIMKLYRRPMPGFSGGGLTVS
ncbi:MAG: hypothetical protein COA42_22805 [Alteromonadaceae bacterium]|nr:hypothetical protein [Colwellia sp.]PCK01717.1 MAG: hypothetical protein COA42_22805 [Alteromonadaceae bacterium]